MRMKKSKQIIALICFIGAILSFFLVLTTMIPMIFVLVGIVLFMAYMILMVVSFDDEDDGDND